MKVFFLLLSVAALPILLVGMIRPQLVLPNRLSPTRRGVVAFYGLGMLVSVLLFVFGPASPSRNDAPDPALVGRWSGRGEIHADGTTQRELVVNVEIHADGHVSGSLGDAHIATGQLWNQDVALRWLGNGSHVVRMTLTGPLVAVDSIYRSEASFGFKGAGTDTIEGGLHAYSVASGEVVAMSQKQQGWFGLTAVRLTRQ